VRWWEWVGRVGAAGGGGRWGAGDFTRYAL